MRTRARKTTAEVRLERSVGQLTLAKLVDAIREGEEWTKREMADRLEVSPSYYSDFLAGRKPVSVRKAAEWAEVLGYDEQQFVRLAVQDMLQAEELHYDVELAVSRG